MNCISSAITGCTLCANNYENPTIASLPSSFQCTDKTIACNISGYVKVPASVSGAG